MKILSIDQSYTSSGIILLNNGNIAYMENFKTDKSVCIFSRASIIADHIVKLADKYQPDIVALEGLAFGMRGSATRDLAGLQFAIVIALQVKNNFNVEIVAPLTVKKTATGNGRAKKEDLLNVTPPDIIESFKDKLSVKKTTGLYDMVDAFWIGKTIDILNKNKTNNNNNK